MISVDKSSNWILIVVLPCVFARLGFFVSIYFFLHDLLREFCFVPYLILLERNRLCIGRDLNVHIGELPEEVFPV